MKVAVSATGPDLNAEVDPRFGRCQYFVIVDSDTMEAEGVSNANAMAGGGAGIAAAQLVASKGAEVLLTGHAGPNAFQTLTAVNVQVMTGVTGKVRDAVEGYKAGRYKSISEPDVTDHFGSAPGGGFGGPSSSGGQMGGGRGMGRGGGGGRGGGRGMGQGI
ncbi:NifB/NifX family molybdenum-iron cluster-binding protein [Chloroflexota bacterium]